MMDLNNHNLLVEPVNPKTLSESEYKKIAEIEKDMWSHGIGEYVKCKNCGEIHSKKDIFGHLSKEIFLKTVSKIEELLGLDRISCIKCNNDTNFIYNETEYISEIRKRYCNSINSFLTVLRDDDGEIRGFIDGYVENFGVIYERELEQYYGNICIGKILLLIKKALGGYLPDEFLLCSSVGIEGVYGNRFILFELFNFFFKSILDSGNKNIIGLYEANMQNNVYAIYDYFGAKGIGINNKEHRNLILNKTENTNSDIFVHENMATNFVNGLDGGKNEFLESYKNYKS